MALIQLNPKQQHCLGQIDNLLDLQRKLIRKRAIEAARLDRLGLDRLPSRKDSVKFHELKKGTAVIEKIAPYRSGVVAGFGFLARYGKTAIIAWDNGSGSSFALAEHLQLRFKQLALFDPECLVRNY